MDKFQMRESDEIDVGFGVEGININQEQLFGKTNQKWTYRFNHILL